LDNPITEEEIVKVLSQMKNNKAAGTDGIVAEILKKHWIQKSPHNSNLFSISFGKGQKCLKIFVKPLL
jgi:hypothetical protein